MSIILKGKPVSDKIKIEIKEKMDILNKKDIKTKMATVRLGEHSDDITYENNIHRNCERLGIESLKIVKSEDISTEELLEVLDGLNKDKDISGILMLSLLTNREDHEIIRHAIDIDKDIDAIHPINQEKIFRGELDGFAPCAAKASMEILDHYNVEIEGKNIVIVNRSMVIGKPLSMMMLAKNGTVTICHTKTKDLKDIMRRGDIVLTAIGEANYFDSSYFNKNAVVLDIGIGFDKEGKLCGDIHYDDVLGNVSMITPVPGGIGGITTSILLDHVVSARYKKEIE